MIETVAALGLMGITLGLVGIMLGLMVKIYFIVGMHTRDIKYIKQTIGMTGCKGSGNNGMENDSLKGNHNTR